MDVSEFDTDTLLRQLRGNLEATRVRPADAEKARGAITAILSELERRGYSEEAARGVIDAGIV